MFDATPFTSHAGVPLTWKICCDGLTDADWSCIAAQVAQRIRFRAVVGVPTGGLRFAAALGRYCDPAADTTLIVDDVLTTGKSMDEAANTANGPCRGIVLFARNAPPAWILPVFLLTAPFRWETRP